MSTTNQQDLVVRAEKALGMARKIALDQKQGAAVRGFVLCRRIQQAIDRGALPSAADVESLERLLSLKLDRLQMPEELLCFDPPPSDSNLAQGDIWILSSLLSNVPIKFTRTLLEAGFQLLSSTGRGKSTLLRHAVRSYASKLDGPAIVLVSKPDRFYEKLCRVPSLAQRTICLRFGIDRFANIFGAPSGNLMDLLSENIPYFQTIYDRRDSGGYLSSILESLCPELSTTHNSGPTLSRVLDKIRNTKVPGYNPMLKQSLLAVFQPMAHRALGISAMSCTQGISWRDCLRKKLVVIIDCSALDAADTHWFLSSLLAYLRKLVELDPNIPRPMIAVDEAGSLIREDWSSGGHGKFASPLSIETPLLRSAGIPLALGFHTLQKGDPRIRANSAITLIGALSHGPDKQAAAQCGDLNPEQTAVIGLLPIGIGILKLLGHQPFLVSWNPPEPYSDITEQERLANNHAILKTLPPIVAERAPSPVALISHSAASTPARMVGSSTNPAIASAVAPNPTQHSTTHSAPSLTLQEQAILKHIYSSPFRNVTERASDIGVSYQQVKLSLDSLSKRRLCGQLAIRMNSRGGNSVYAYLERDGYLLINQPIPKHRGGTDFAHAFLQKFYQWLILSCTKIRADLEVTRNGSPQVDLGCQDPATGLWTASEVVCSTASTEPLKAQKTLVSWDRLILIAATTPERNQLEQAFLNSGISFGNTQHPVICVPADIKECRSFQQVYDFTGLVYARPSRS